MRPTKKFLILYLAGLFAVLASRWPGHDSEDIKNLRVNANGPQPNDFWGGASSFFYGRFPNFYPGWESLLLTFQWGLTCAGLVLLSRRIASGWKPLVAWYAISMLIVELGTLLTRDGLMLGVLVFGFGLISISRNQHIKYKNLISKLALLVFLFAASFRPWVSPAIVIFYIYLTNFPAPNPTWRLRLLKRFILIFFFVSTALCIEFGTSKILNLEKSYPEQQVMVMDMASMACWSTNQETVDKALSGLKPFYTDGVVPVYICNTFRPTNWIHLFHQDLVTKQQPNFRLIQVGSDYVYRDLRTDWLKLIVTSPVDYIQNKFMYAAQTLLGGDTRGIRLLSVNYLEDTKRTRIFAIFSALVLLPLDIAISLHLFSPLVTFFLLFLVCIGVRMKAPNSSQDTNFLGLSLFGLFWFAGTVVAYIGDTARFTYSSGALVLLSILWDKLGLKRIN